MPTKPLVYKSPDDGKDLSIFLGGDTFLGFAAQSILESKGYTYPFKYLRSIYKEADVRTLNLEAPISKMAKELTAEKKYKYNMSPRVLEGFKKEKFDIFYMANNHTTDYGHDGLLESIALLKKEKMIPLGAGKNIEEAKKALIIKKGTIQAAILNYMSYRKNYDEKYHHFASHNHSGVRALSEQAVQEDIQQLRKLGVHVIIVSIHWGDNYEPVSKKQKRQAEMISAAGADVIVGHGSHQFQNIGIANKIPVFFSVGNFIFHTTPNRTSSLTYGFPLTLHMNEKGLTKVDVWPIHTNNKTVKFQPRHLSGSTAHTAIQELFSQSDLGKWKTKIANDRGIIYF
ncbi:hypothetical protein AC623_14360 [Bacillus sp. FJAT-27231]|uniref:CapA family protein n=1 Tax=Bacillus sp. FJAT-27231 TaxID=1679168 RepID=UPI0006717DF4|nr:CapA family protein [Bacillus sp. FJAT-27231]KMY54969.1 hypothetical protein AC623_14360 [Bacillus sp. FJAT-27231]